MKQILHCNKCFEQLVRKCDVCVVDLDQCIYPGFTQTTLGALLLIKSLKNPYRRFFPRLLSGAGYICCIRSRQLFGKKPSNYELMFNFCRVIKGLPLSLVEACALRLPKKGPQFWRVALAKLSIRMKVFLLTFSIEPIARAYGEVKDIQGRKIFQGWKGTPLLLKEGKIQGCAINSVSLSPPAKLEAMEVILSAGGFRRPLIIGHSADEALMARRSREMGGSSIRLVKHSRPVEGFEYELDGNGWKKLVAVLGEIN